MINPMRDKVEIKPVVQKSVGGRAPSGNGYRIYLGRVNAPKKKKCEGFPMLFIIPQSQSLI